MIRGSAILARKPNTRKKRIVPMMNSGHEGSNGLYDAWSAASEIMVRSLPGRGSSGVVEDERRHEADQSERLGEREADPHVQRDAAGGLGLPGHGLDRVAEHQADADARADGGETVPERSEAHDVDRLSGARGGESSGE